MANYLLPNNAVTLVVAASDKLATWGVSPYSVIKSVGSPNIPATEAIVYLGSGANTTTAFSTATSVTIAAGDTGLYYETGTGPVISEQYNLAGKQGAPGTLNTTGTLTAALILGGIVTSTTAAAVTATLDTGAVMDAVIDLSVNDGFWWSAINTGGANAFTVTAAANGHTIVGSGADAASSTGLFFTRRTAADTWVTYRV